MTSDFLILGTFGGNQFAYFEIPVNQGFVPVLSMLVILVLGIRLLFSHEFGNRLFLFIILLILRIL